MMPFLAFFELKSQLFKQPKMYIFIQVYFWNLLEKYYMLDILNGHVRRRVKKKIG